jgi:hypothetical protein
MGSPEQYVGKDPAVVERWIAEQQTKAAKLSDNHVVKAVNLVGRLFGNKPADPGALAGIYAAVEALDLMEIYRGVRGPLQVFNAHAPQRGLAAHLMKDPDDMNGAYRAGIRRDLMALSQTNPHVELVELDATHMLILTHAEQTAALMTRFLSTCGSQPR